MGTFRDYAYTLLQRPRIVKQNRRNEVRNFLYSNKNIDIVIQRKPYIDHSKVIVVDDILIQGGMNIGDEYDNEWIDFMTYIRGLSFSERVIDRLNDPGITEFSLDDGNCKLIRQLPYISGGTPYLNEVIESIGNAEEKIILCGGYLSHPKILNALIQAPKQSGVAIQLIIPKDPNVQRYDIQKSLEFLSQEIPDISIVYTSEMIHAKLLYTERGVIIGSGNFDIISGGFTGELGVHILGNSEILRYIEEYLQRIVDSNEIYQDEFSSLFHERKLKSIIESYMQRAILRMKLLG